MFVRVIGWEGSKYYSKVIFREKTYQVREKNTLLPKISNIPLVNLSSATFAKLLSRLVLPPDSGPVPDSWVSPRPIHRNLQTQPGPHCLLSPSHWQTFAVKTGNNSCSIGDPNTLRFTPSLSLRLGNFFGNFLQSWPSGQVEPRNWRTFYRNVNNGWTLRKY